VEDTDVLPDPFLREPKPAMHASARLFLFAVSILSPWSAAAGAARPTPVPRASCPRAQQTPPGLGPASGPALPPRVWSTVTRRLFADGSVDCTGADDTSQPVGTVTLASRNGGLSYDVQLALGPSMGGWPYFLELSLDGTCANRLQFPFVLDPSGDARLAGFYPAPSGPQSVLVDLVSAALAAPPDPKLREIATSGLLWIAVPDDGSTLLTLDFDGGSSAPLPWSEQGFTFTGAGQVSGQQLALFLSSTGTGVTGSVTLVRASGGTFDAVALSADLFQGLAANAEAWVTSDRGGYEPLWGGPTVLRGPGWKGITTLTLTLGVFGDDVAWLEADDFLVRVR